MVIRFYCWYLQEFHNLQMKQEATSADHEHAGKTIQTEPLSCLKDCEMSSERLLNDYKAKNETSSLLQM